MKENAIQLTAKSIEADLIYLLNYSSQAKACKENVSAELFIQDSKYLTEAVKQVIHELRILPPFKQHLEDLFHEAEGLSFEQGVKYWKIIIELLRYIRLKS